MTSSKKEEFLQRLKECPIERSQIHAITEAASNLSEEAADNILKTMNQTNQHLEELFSHPEYQKYIEDCVSVSVDRPFIIGVNFSNDIQGSGNTEKIKSIISNYMGYFHQVIDHGEFLVSLSHVPSGIHEGVYFDSYYTMEKGYNLSLNFTPVDYGADITVAGNGANFNVALANLMKSILLELRVISPLPTIFVNQMRKEIKKLEGYKRGPNNNTRSERSLNSRISQKKVANG